jgi:hypothetical protein
MQKIIWAFSRTPPRSADANADIAIHHRIGRGTLNLTRTEPAPTPSKTGLATVGHEESDEKAEGDINGESERRGGFANIMHGALCITGFLLVLPSGVLVVQYAKMTGSPGAFRLHQLLQFGLGSRPPFSNRSTPLTYPTLCMIQLAGSSREARLRIGSWMTMGRMRQWHTR